MMVGLGVLVFVGLLIALANHTMAARSIAQILHDLEHRTGDRR